MFDIIDARKPNVEQGEKVGLIGGQRLACQNLQEIAEIVAPAMSFEQHKDLRMEGHPFDIVKKDQAASDQ